MSDRRYFEGSKNPLNIFKSAAFDLKFIRNNPYFFDPVGIWIFCGSQGSGKTLSAVKCVKALLKAYPGAKLCSNLNIKGIDTPIIPFTDYEQLIELHNDIYGMIFLVDEIHLLWNSLESRNISIEEIAQFCQMRKERRIIIGTSQVYSRIAKPIREQLKYVIMCRSFLKYIQLNKIVDPQAEGYTGEHDGELDGQIIGTELWFHHPSDYLAYDTYNKIVRFDRKKEGKKK